LAVPVVLVDYGVGNLLSVRQALEEVGGEVIQTADPRLVGEAERIIIPGVGAFSHCIGRLAEEGLVDVVREVSRSGRPVLGICVGMQMLLDMSEEFGEHAGLGLIPGAVRRIPDRDGNGERIKIPHIGWTPIEPAHGSQEWAATPLAGVSPGEHFYFVHSYNAQPDRSENRIADAFYGGHRIGAVIGAGNTFGCQFHPEKSGPAGLGMLKRFLELRPA
jgi:glutamine amidotransferase